MAWILSNLEAPSVRRILVLTAILPWLVLAAPKRPTIDEILAKLPAPEASYISAEQLAKPGFQAKDDKGSCVVVPAAVAGGAPTYRIAVTEKPEKHWETGLKWSTPKGTGPKRDDVVLVTFEARCTDEGRQAKGQVRPVLRRSVKPYHTALGGTCVLGKNWQRLNLVATPSADMVDDGILVGLNLGLQVQKVEIRDVRVLNFGKKVSRAQFIKAVGASPQQGGSRAVGQALDPGMLWEMAAFADFTPTPGDFKADGTWQATYGIFTCHGYMLKANKHLGLLRLERTPRDDGTFDLKVTQTIQLDAAMRHVTEAVAQCRADALATPISWTLKSRFLDAHGAPIPDLDADEKGPLPGAAAGPATGDWCLFEAVQRLTPQTEIPTFSLLEGMSVVKEGQRLAYRGEESHQIAGEAREFRRYVQIGHGVLPINYWLDAKGRLQLVVTHSRAYLLIPEAVANYEKYSQSQLSRYRKKSAQRQKQGVK